MSTGALEDDGLFDFEAPPPVSLSDRFGMPPFSVLDRRGGAWQDRRRRWLSLGIRSELGRDGGLIASEDTGYVQSTVPMEQRSDRALEASAKGQSREAKQARRILEARAQGTPRRLIPGAQGVGGAYDRSRPEGTLNRARLNEAGAHRDQDKLNAITGQDASSGTSIFDPVLCELAYRWYTRRGMRTLDPFAGGSVRGVVSGILERHYLGVDLRGVQIEANRAQGRDILKSSPFMPRWVPGDSAEVLSRAPAQSVDFVFSCPPYADLEVYSDDPRDISNMPFEQFKRVHAEIIFEACRALKPNRFAAWVISDVRDKRTGCYQDLIGATVRAFEEAGLGYYNDAVILDPVGSAAVRAGKIFNGGRKLTRMHQHMLIFLKGNWKQATSEVSEEEIVLEVPEKESGA